MGTRKLAQSHYTAFSRVTNLNNLHILELNKAKISVYDCTKVEMQRLRSEHQLQLCYTPVYELPSESHRIIFHNIRSLHKHHTDIASDENYLAADLIAIAESRLITTDSDDDFSLADFTLLRNDQDQVGHTRPPHGLAIYVKNCYTINNSYHYTSRHIEYSYVCVESPSSKALQLVTLYKAQSCPVSLLRDSASVINNLLDQSVPALVVGDFNVDVANINNIQLLCSLQSCLQAQQQVSKPTTDHGTMI